MPKKTKKTVKTGAALSRDSRRLTYRELRNTPGLVWERLSHNEPLTLIADGEAKAIVIPVPDGDVTTALEAYQRGRAMLALRQIREKAKRNGTAEMPLEQINEVIREVRKERRRRARGE